MKWKKLAVLLGAVLTVPAAVIAGYLIASPFYMRFVFDGEVKDFAPGDSFGVLFYTLVFSIAILIGATFGWLRVYRRISS
jgi:hypothetical protein